MLAYQLLCIFYAQLANPAAEMNLLGGNLPEHHLSFADSRLGGDILQRDTIGEVCLSFFPCLYLVGNVLYFCIAQCQTLLLGVG